jgi:hypothetical protein
MYILFLRWQKKKIPCESMWHLILFSITHRCGIYCIMNALRCRCVASKETSSKLLYAKEREKSAEKFYDFVWMEEKSYESCSIHFRTYQVWQFHCGIQIAETIKGLGIIFVYIYTVYRFAAQQLRVSLVSKCHKWQVWWLPNWILLLYSEASHSRSRQAH